MFKQAEQMAYQALLLNSLNYMLNAVDYTEQLRALIGYTEKLAPEVADAVRDYSVYAEWNQVYNDPESTQSIEKFNGLIMENLVRHLGYNELVLIGTGNWNIRFKCNGVVGMEMYQIIRENLTKGEAIVVKKLTRATGLRALFEAYTELTKLSYESGMVLDE